MHKLVLQAASGSTDNGASAEEPQRAQQPPQAQAEQPPAEESEDDGPALDSQPADGERGPETEEDDVPNMDRRAVTWLEVRFLAHQSTNPIFKCGLCRALSTK